jgi:hypothetical protein
MNPSPQVRRPMKLLTAAWQFLCEGSFFRFAELGFSLAFLSDSSLKFDFSIADSSTLICVLHRKLRSRFGLSASQAIGFNALC